MKRMSCIALLLSICFASNIFSMTTYQMDAITAAGMRSLSTSGGGDFAILRYVGYKPGGLSDRVYGSSPNYGDNMVYGVGFSGGLYAAETGSSGEASITLGLYNSGASLGLSGNYDGWLLPISNDNDDTWSYQAYVIYNLGAGEITVDSGDFVSLLHDTQSSLLVLTPAYLDFSNVVGIGYTIKWLNINNPDGQGEYRTGDEFHTSVIPAPGALLLGLIGLGSLRLKFRKTV